MIELLFKEPDQSADTAEEQKLHFLSVLVLTCRLLTFDNLQHQVQYSYVKEGGGCGWWEGSNLQQEELWDARLDTLKRRIRKIRAMSEGRHSGSLGVAVSYLT